MVGVAGLEPAALWSRTIRATKLRYTPTKLYYYNRAENFVQQYSLRKIG